jgi:precorrin-6Y C5,15-methyltransferase (decarboxylating)
MSRPVLVIGVPMDAAPDPKALARHCGPGTLDLLAFSQRFETLAVRAFPRARRTVALGSELTGAVEEIARAHEKGGHVVVLATGDPGFFGIGRLLGERLGRRNIRVIPAASSVAVAVGRLGLTWDDAVVVSVHGRGLDEAVEQIKTAGKAAVLTSAETPPQAVARLLIDRGPRFDHAAVISGLGSDDEQVHEADLESVAAGTWNGLSVLVCWNGSGVAHSPALSTPVLARTPPELTHARVGERLPASLFGRSETAFAQRPGMITKPEVRSVCLAKLELPRSGVLWDVGAGSGSVGIEALGLSPALRVLAIERDTRQVEHIRENALRFEADRLEVIEGEAPACLAGLPDPDRVFVGGGGIGVLEAVLVRLRPGGRVVATYTSLERAARAARLLGDLVQLSVSRGVTLKDGTLRLAGLDPVFISFGDKAAS